MGMLFRLDDLAHKLAAYHLWLTMMLALASDMQDSLRQ